MLTRSKNKELNTTMTWHVLILNKAQYLRQKMQQLEWHKKLSEISMSSIRFKSEIKKLHKQIMFVLFYIIS